MTREWLLLKYGSIANIIELYDNWVVMDTQGIQPNPFPFSKEEDETIQEMIDEEEWNRHNEYYSK